MKTALIPALEDVRHRASRLDLESDRNDLPLDGDASLPTGAAEDGPASRAGREDADILKEIARQIREGALSARPTRNTASGSTPSASNIAPNGEARQIADGSESPAHHSRRPAFPVLDPDHFAKLAHELKTPLTAIAAAAEIMRDERLGEMGNERYLSYAADIHESATHALDVITSLLSESAKPDAAMSRPIALDLNAIVKRTVSSVQALAELHGLALVFDAGDGRPHIVANPTAMRQILLNLLTNAIKFTPRGGDVRVATGHIKDGRIFLVVRDTGCGMNGKTHADSACHFCCIFWRRFRAVGAWTWHRSATRAAARARDGRQHRDRQRSRKGTVVLIAFGGSSRSSA